MLLQEAALCECFGPTFAQGVLLAGHPFDVDWVRTPDTRIYFQMGQPLGYYSSWPLFALNHHLMIWWCADKVYPGQVFDRYAVLGDDLVVIADESVAKVYLEALKEHGIPVSKQKSLVSDNGSLEFAKRFFVRRASVDLSAVSLKCLMNYYHPYGLLAIHMTYPIKRFATLLY